MREAQARRTIADLRTGVTANESAELPSELVDDAYNVYLGVLAVTLLLQDYHHTHGHIAHVDLFFVGRLEQAG